MVRSLFMALVVAMVFCGGNALAAEAPKTYKIDPSHTRVLYFANHLGFSKLAGVFNDVSGDIIFTPNDVVNARADITINAKSLSMGNAALDTKLQGPDYFNTMAYPTIRFVTTSIQKTGSNTGIIKGDLTLIGVTRPVTLDVRFNHLAFNRYANANAVGFSARGRINRSDFGMKTLLPDVADQIDLRIEAEATQSGK